MTNVTTLSRDDFLDGAAERRVITAFRRDGIEECLYEDLGALGWAPEHIATIARGGNVRTGYGHLED
jgi:hypothetical protein